MQPESLIPGRAGELHAEVEAVGTTSITQPSYKPQGKSRLEFLDAGRGVAILGVIAVHTVQNFPTGSKWLDFVIGTGQFGVQLFFMISAFTMMHTMAGRVGKERHLVVNFWMRRFFRIAIPFWAGIVIYQCFRFAHVEYFVSTSSDLFSIVTSFLLIQGFWPGSFSSIVPGGGSIATEVIFYMIFPLIFWMNSNVIKISIFGLLLIILDRVAIRPAYMEVFSLFNFPIQDIDRNFFYYYIFNQIPVFLFGIFIYIFSHEKKIGYLSKLEIICLMFFLIGFIIASSKLAVISIVGGLILFVLKKINNLSNWLISIGRHSYSLYLFHFAVINIMLIVLGGRPSQPSIMVFLSGYFLAVSGTILISLVTKPLLEDVGSTIGRLLVDFSERRIKLVEVG